MFVDHADLLVAAGDGGNGCSSFRREKFVPHGGPDGGDGGRGGSIFLRATTHHNTLVSYQHQPQFRAQRGAHGEGSNRTGRSGKNLVLEVPVGTIVHEVIEQKVALLADLTETRQEIEVAKGGRGGRGNQHFSSSRNQAPLQSEPGHPGEVRNLRLTLKLLADVGLVGFPNVGKSTLIARMSAARPKVANYPFTTLTPHLGVVELSDHRSFVLADVPGLIKGAHQGIGLGHKFLSHLERTKVLVHIVDVSSGSGRNPVEDYEVIRKELTEYQVPSIESTGLALADKPQLVVASKVDVLDEPKRLEDLKNHLRALGIQVFSISSITGQGLKPLVEAMWNAVESSSRSGVTPSKGTAV